MRDLERGRIFRVIPKDHNGYSFAKRNVNTLDGAINALMSSDLESRYLGWKSLHEMGLDKTEKSLMKLISDKDRIKRARAAWCLGKMPGAGDKVISKISKDLDSDMRIVAIRLARQLGSNVESLISELSNDVSFQVKRECAIALRELDGENVAKLWAKLALQHNGSDRWYLEALGIAADGNWDNCFKAWIEAGGKWDSKAGKDIVWRSRGKMAPEFLDKIVKGSNTN